MGEYDNFTSFTLTPSLSVTNFPSVSLNLNSTFAPSSIEASDSPVLELEQAFEYALMLWYSAFMFVASGILFVLSSIPFLRSYWPILIQRGLDVASWSSLYFAFAVTLVVYNKWLIAVWEGGFRFPLMMTLVHMSLKLLMSWTVVRGCRAREEIPRVSRFTYYFYACPVGTTTALDVAASNASLFYVSVTLYTVIKSTSLVFVLLYSVLYRLQSCSFSLVVVTMVIFSGVLLASYGDSQFDPIGFTLVFASSAIAGYRWALTEVLMDRIGTKMNSLMTIYTISPASVISLIPFVLWLEFGPFSRSKFYNDPGLFVLAILNVCGSGIFAFAMIYVELAVLNRTSSLTLVIISYLKQMAQIIVSVIVFHEHLSVLNIVGVIITFIGMGFYAKVKHTTSVHGARPAPKPKRRRGAVVTPRDFDDSRLPLAENETSFEDVSIESPPTVRNRHESYEMVALE